MPTFSPLSQSGLHARPKGARATSQISGAIMVAIASLLLLEQSSDRTGRCRNQDRQWPAVRGAKCNIGQTR
jgi:hypothetical protein